jgi:hypothetical protein
MAISRAAQKVLDRRKKSKGSSSNLPFTEEELMALSQKMGYEPPKPKGPSMWNRAIGLLSSMETGNAVYNWLDNKDPLASYAGDVAKGATLQGLPAEKKTYSDVLEKLGMPEGPKLGPVSARSVLGLAGDIVLDPSTWFGGAIAKGLAKGGKAVGKTAFNIAEKAPVMGKYVTKAGETAKLAKEGLEDVFVPYAKIKRMGPDGEKLAEYLSGMGKKFRGDVTENAEKLFQMKKKLFEETGTKPEEITKMVESGMFDDKTTQGFVAKYVSDLFKRFAAEEGKRGLLKTNMDNYVAHLWTDEWREFVGKNGNQLAATLKPLMPKLKSAKPRTILKTVEEINEKTLAEHGVKMFEDDIFRIAAARGVDHFRAVNTYDLLKTVEKNFGLNTKLLPALREYVEIDGLKYVKFKPEGGIRIFKTVNEPSKDILKQLKFTANRGFERSMTETGQLLKVADQYGIPVVKNNRLRTALGQIRNRKLYPDSVIELQSYNPEVLAHEEGHLWDWLFGKQKEDISVALQKMKGIDKEMKWATRNFPIRFRGKPYASTSTEQFAEGMSEFIANRPTAELMMPKFTAYIDSFVKKDPDTYQKFTNLKEFFKKTNEMFPPVKAKPLSAIPTQPKGVGGVAPEIKNLSQGLDDNLIKGVKAAFPTKQGLGVTTKVKEYLLPEPIAQHLKETYQLWTSDESIHKFLKSYDKVMSFWKGSVTGIFPAFHGRNLMGGMWNNYLAGMYDPTLYKKALDVTKEGSTGTITLAGKQRTFEELRLLMKENAVMGQTGMMDVGKTMEKILNPSKGLAKIKDLPQEAMTKVENVLRGSLFMDGLNKGMTPAEAAKRVMTFHFDYAPEGLTSFERGVMKRLIPFYTWVRNNLPLQLTQMMKQPAKYSMAGKTLRSLSGGTSEERMQVEKLPDYMKQTPPIRLGGTKENPEYMYGLGLPFEDINRMGFSDLISQLSPLIKAPIELKTGYNFYADQPTFKTAKAPSYMRGMPEPIKKLMGYHERKKEDGDVVRTVDPVRMGILNAVAGRASAQLDKSFDEKLSTISKVIYSLLGSKAKVVDMESEEYFRLKERTDQLMKFLESRGILKEFSTYYKPKEY